MPTDRTTIEGRVCGRKMIHPNEESAKAEAKRLHKVTKARYRTYRCGFCNGFHVATIRTEDQCERRRNAQA